MLLNESQYVQIAEVFGILFGGVFLNRTRRSPKAGGFTVLCITIDASTPYLVLPLGYDPSSNPYKGLVLPIETIEAKSNYFKWIENHCQK